jgi:hypothetical protein
LGANQGGHENGLRNAVAQTATDRANAMGEELQKERKWIELDSGAETFAVLISLSPLGMLEPLMEDKSGSISQVEKK